MFFEELQKAFDIFKKYPRGPYPGDNYFISAAEHDVIFSSWSAEDISPESEDGKALTKLGWHIQDDISWAHFV